MIGVGNVSAYHRQSLPTTSPTLQLPHIKKVAGGEGALSKIPARASFQPGPERPHASTHLARSLLFTTGHDWIVLLPLMSQASQTRGSRCIH